MIKQLCFLPLSSLVLETSKNLVFVKNKNGATFALEPYKSMFTLGTLNTNRTSGADGFARNDNQTLLKKKQQRLENVDFAPKKSVLSVIYAMPNIESTQMRGLAQ